MIGFACGMRVRIVRDNGRDGIVGFEGTIDMVTPSGVIVILDSDPANTFRMYQAGGYTRPHKDLVVRRFFLPNAVEVIA